MIANNFTGEETEAERELDLPRVTEVASGIRLALSHLVLKSGVPSTTQ